MFVNNLILGEFAEMKFPLILNYNKKKYYAIYVK